MALLDESGATSMMVSSIYIASSFANTFNAAEGLNNGSVEDVQVVMSTLASLWLTGLLALVMHWVVDYRKKAKAKRVQPADPTDAMKSVLVYVNHTVPAVFCDKGHWSTFH